MRLIDLDSAEKIIEKEIESGAETIPLVTLRSWLNDRPIITPESLVKRGRWGFDGKCTECGFDSDYGDMWFESNYCPVCGAKMVAEPEAALTPTPASDVPEGGE